jgi:hypothetical protein
MDYSTELERAIDLKDALEVIISNMTELRPEYLPFNVVVIGLLLRTVPVINVECEDDPDFQVQGREPVGGLWEGYRELLGVVEALELELELEMPSAPEPYIGPEYLI